MRAWAIYKKELKLYFSSPIAYAVLAIFALIAGWFFYNVFAFYVLASMQAAMNPMMARDLTIVERELGFRYELPDGGHYQDVCPKCRRALFGLAQGALWRAYLSARETGEGG